jgi:glycogen debranching enzyme
MSYSAGIPVFSCGDSNLESAFRLALETLSANTRPFRSGLLREARPCLMAGADYPSPWTRDAAINVWFAEALLDPETARNTLLGVLEDKPGGPVVGGQYWDRIIWALGAERLFDLTRDSSFARFAYDILCRTASLCLQEEYDPSDGLFRGPAVYGDGVSAYPERYRNPSLSSSILCWPEEHPGQRVAVGAGIPMKALSTNCIYEHAFRIIARLAGILDEDPDPWIRRAESLKKAVNAAFWNPAAGRYDYLAGECDAQESLGLAFAVLFGIADEARTRSIMELTVRTEQGIPCVWPAFPPYCADGFGRHCGTVWPHIQGFWALAALKAGRADLFSRELFTLARHAVRDGQFAEIYHPEDGRIYGGIQDGGGKYLEWRSCSGQTWSASALLAMVFYGIFGLNPAGSPEHPFLPEGLSHAELRGLQAGGKTIHLTIGKNA